MVEPEQNRRQRRAAVFGEPRIMPDPIPTPAERKGFRVDFTLTIFLALIGAIIAISPPQSRLSMAVALSLFFVIGVYPLLHLITWLFRLIGQDFYYSFSLPAYFLGFTLWIAGIVMWGLNVWPPIHRHILSAKERARFEEPLRAQNSPRDELEIACPNYDNVVCTYAAQFIEIFREAGWKIKDNQVTRVEIKIPHVGVVLVRHSDKLPDPDKPGSGVWNAITPSLETVRQAFVNVGIEPDSSVSTDFPDTIMVVSFGTEREDESAPTPFTAMMDRMRNFRKERPESMRQP